MACCNSPIRLPTAEALDSIAQSLHRNHDSPSPILAGPARTWERSGVRAGCRLSFVTLPLLIACILLPFSATIVNGAPPELRSTSKPNIIFILADDLGYGELGSYGQEKIKTPNLDQLAKEGVRFTSVYAGTTVCAPSRAVLMTGLHTGHVRVRGNDKTPLAKEDVTVAQVLRRGGYFTCAIGKWGLGNVGTDGTPNKKGFDEWFGYLDQTHAHDYYTDYLFRNDISNSAVKIPIQENLYGRKGYYIPDYFTKAALRFLTNNTSRPLFLYLAYTIPHANNELKDQGMQVPSDKPYSDEQWPQPEKNKAAMITRMDTYIGALLRALKDFKLEEKTIIFFSSDNGPHKEGGVDPAFFKASGPLRGIKRDMYEGGIRVPMIVRWPGKIKPGTVSDESWGFQDFMPTACELAGTAAPKNIDGISYLPTILGKPQTAKHDFFYWEFHEKGSKQAVRMGDWKAIRPGVGQPLELYDLKHDLGEKDNVAAKHADVISKIETYLKTARTESKDWPLLPPPAEKPADKRIQ